MNNKECIERLRFIKAGSNNHKSTMEAIDHAIAQLERLDKIKEHIGKLIDYRAQRAEDNEAVGIGSLQHRASLDTLMELRDFIKGEKSHE